jgi:hypothetical protein
MYVKARLKALLRALMRRAVPFVMRRPRLAALAGRAVGKMPSLRLRLRNMVSMPGTLPRSERNLSPEQAAALVDLRRALKAAHGRGR